MAHLRSVSRVLTVPGLVAVLMLASACASNRAASGAGDLAGQSPKVSPNPPATSAPASNPTSGTTASGTTKTGTTTAPPTKVVTGPRIVSFIITQQPACPVVGTSDAPYHNDGTSIKLSWNVTGGVKQVALSLDDPGFFKQYGTGSISTYPPQGSVELAFECNPTDQPTTTHKYTLDTIGGGASVEKTITVTKQTSP